MSSTEGSYWKVRNAMQSFATSRGDVPRYNATWTRLAALLANWKLTIDCFICIAEDNMNVQLKDITVTARDGRVSHLDQVYIRGSHVRFFIVPDMLRYAECSCHWPMCSNSQVNVIPGGRQLTSLFSLIGTPPCSAHEASVGAVSVWRVVGLQCSGRVASGGVELAHEVDMNCVNELETCYKAGLTEWLAFVFVFYLLVVVGKFPPVFRLAALLLLAIVCEDFVSPHSRNVTRDRSRSIYECAGTESEGRRHSMRDTRR